MRHMSLLTLASCVPAAAGLPGQWWAHDLARLQLGHVSSPFCELLAGSFGLPGHSLAELPLSYLAHEVQFVLGACCSVGCQGDLWAIVMDAGTPFSSQLYRVSPNAFLPKDWIMEKWEQGYYITAVAGESGCMDLAACTVLGRAGGSCRCR